MESEPFLPKNRIKFPVGLIAKGLSVRVVRTSSKTISFCLSMCCHVLLSERAEAINVIDVKLLRIPGNLPFAINIKLYVLTVFVFVELFNGLFDVAATAQLDDCCVGYVADVRSVQEN